MRDLIIGKDVAYALSTATGVIAGSWASDLLTDGAIAIVDNGGTIVAHNVASITAPYVKLITKTSSGSVKTSFPLYKGKTTYSKLAYVAPVAAVKFVGSDLVGAAGDYSFNLPSTLSVGDVVGIGIINKDKAEEVSGRMMPYEYTVVAGDVMTGILTNNVFKKLIAKINADPNKIVTAAAHLSGDGTGNVDGIKFTGTAGTDFGIYRIPGVLQNADIVEYLLVNGETDTDSDEAVAFVRGSGTVAQIQAYLDATKSRDGNQNYLLNQDLLYSGGSQIVAGTTYTTYTFKTEVPNDQEISRTSAFEQTLMIAVPSGSSAVIAAIDNLGAKIV